MNIISVNGIEIAYERAGQGPVVALIGGVDMDAAIWKRTYAGAFLRSGFEVLMINLRGVPPSSCMAPPYPVALLADDCEGVLAALGIDECFVVGASLGAFVAQELVLTHPSGKKGLALIATSLKQTAWARMLTKAELALYASADPLPVDYLIASDLLQMLTVDELCNDDLVHKLTALMKDKDHTAIGRRGLMSAVADYEGCMDRLHTLAVPTIFISFANDVLTPALLVKQAVAQLPNSRYVEIDASGHFGIYSKSKQIGAEILAYFDTLASHAEAAQE